MTSRTGNVLFTVHQNTITHKTLEETLKVDEERLLMLKCIIVLLNILYFQFHDNNDNFNSKIDFQGDKLIVKRSYELIK